MRKRNTKKNMKSTGNIRRKEEGKAWLEKN
jgi:hypothetical protein